MFSQSYFVGVDSGSSIFVFLAVIVYFMHGFLKSVELIRCFKCQFCLIWSLTCLAGAFLVCFCSIRVAFLSGHIVSIFVMRLCYFYT